MTDRPRILAYDIETAPILGYSFGLYDTNIIHVVRDSHLLSFSYQWLGEEKIHSHSITDYKLYKRDPYDDTELLKDLHALMDSADVLLAHNGDNFDIRMANMRFIQKGLPSLPPKKTIDTLKIARSRFRFTSNKLTDLAQYAGIGKKLPTDKDLWIDCLSGDPKAWRKMVRYNEHDVRLLVGVYEWLRPWAKVQLNMNVYSGKSWACPHCGSSRVIKRGYQWNMTTKHQKYVCRDCGAWSTGNHNLLDARVGIK